MKNIVRTTLLSIVGTLACALAIFPLPEPAPLHSLGSAIGSGVRKVFRLGGRPTSAPGVTYEMTFEGEVIFHAPSNFCGVAITPDGRNLYLAGSCEEIESSIVVVQSN